MKPMGLLHFGIATLAFWLGVFLFPKSANRVPASAVSEIVDYSGLAADDFKEKAAAYIIQSAKFSKASGIYKIQMGHVYGPDRSLSMCETYKNIILVMKAEGMAIHGEAPTITVTAPCIAEKAATLTNEIMIPYKELTGQAAEDGEFEYNDVKILVDHLDSQWPYQLYVHSISLVGNKSLNISLSDIRRLNRKNFVLDW